DAPPGKSPVPKRPRVCRLPPQRPTPKLASSHSPFAPLHGYGYDAPPPLHPPGGTFMKLGFAISLFIIVLVGLIFFASRGSADRPPPATTAPGALDRLVLPADLPAVFTPADPDTDATPIYERAFAFYTDNAVRFRQEAVSPALVDELVELLI